ncbi:hypothetical protein AKJ09_02234 [Labilithrix luteola]|uniref:Uncharacterized protein n=1 Tax=Labilithrix luteola TaxID=1391654 RepID=A0A0K1PPV4_9BACT|nr:hypothetical protein AKJ09_02234 [Labilithrix luteola]
MMMMMMMPKGPRTAHGCEGTRRHREGVSERSVTEQSDGQRADEHVPSRPFEHQGSPV